MPIQDIYPPIEAAGPPRLSHRGSHDLGSLKGSLKGSSLTRKDRGPRERGEVRDLIK